MLPLGDRLLGVQALQVRPLGPEPSGRQNAPNVLRALVEAGQICASYGAVPPEGVGEGNVRTTRGGRFRAFRGGKISMSGE